MSMVTAMDTDTQTPSLANIRRHNGIAGQFSYSVAVTYPGEAASVVTFVSSVYGGPIVMVTPDGHQVPVSSRVTERIGGTLTPEWVRQFFAPVAN